jgi:hypothetical protein
LEAYKKKLLTENEIRGLQELLEELSPRLNAYISSIGKKVNDKRRMTND